jgi:hypothetical protein
MASSQFNALLRKVVTITFDDPERVTKKGRLVGIVGEFLILETRINRFFIKESSIIALKECLEDGRP